MDTNSHAPVGVDYTMVIYPAPCQDPHAPYGQFITEFCDEAIRIRECVDNGVWEIRVDEFQNEICSGDSSIHMSIETPDGLGNENEDRIIFVNNKADDKLWLTGTIVAVMAFLVGLGVYFYTEIYGNCLNKDRKNIVLFDDPVKGTATDAATLGAFQNDFYEPQKRLPTTYDDNLNYQDNDDNVSEISVSSEIKKDQALHMVFDTIFDSDPGKL